MKTEEAITDAGKLFDLIRLSADSKYTADLANQGVKLVNAILNPEPEMEDVEIVRWECPKCNAVRIDPKFILDHSCEVVAADLIKLTGTVQRPKPQPVEKRVSVEADIADGRGRFEAGTPMSVALGGKNVFSDHPELFGKTVTLTAVYQETPK